MCGLGPTSTTSLEHRCCQVRSAKRRNRVPGIRLAGPWMAPYSSRTQIRGHNIGESMRRCIGAQNENVIICVASCRFVSLVTGIHAFTLRLMSRVCERTWLMGRGEGQSKGQHLLPGKEKGISIDTMQSSYTFTQDR